MSIKWCPTPPFEQYNVGTSFCGPIISLFAPEKGLFHALDIDLFEKFQEFEQHVPTLDLYTEPPKFGEIFLFVNQHQKCYRAYRLNSNRTNMNSIRALLFDVGTEFYINFKKGSFYKMPESFFKTQAMAIFCYAESFPSVDGGQIKSEFLKQSVYKNFKYLIQKSMNIECASGNKKCLVVSVLDANENEDDQLDSHSTMNETLDETLMQPIDNIPINSASRLTSPIKAKSYPNLTYCDDDNFIIALDSKFPEPGERIMICPTQITTPNTLYAHYIKDLTKKLSSDAMSLFIWMNTSSVVKGYRKLKTKPNVGDIVLVFGRNSFFHLNFYRGRVTDNTKELFPIFLIDFGNVLHVNFKYLYKFPREFATLPAQAVHLAFDNFNSYDDPIDFEQAKEITKMMLWPIGVADVISSCLDHLHPTLHVKLYNQDGDDIAEYLRSEGPPML